MYRNLDRDTCRKIIYFRYNSLEDFSTVHRTVAEICRPLRLAWTTVYDYLNRFQARDCDFERSMIRCPSLTKFGSIPSRLLRKLISKKLLQEWAPYTIRERVAIIQRVWDFKMSTTQLEKVYKHHGIKHRAAKQVYRYSITNADRLEGQRKEMAEVLGNLISRRTPVIYMDETAFTTWSIKKKSWSTRRDVNKHHINDQRMAVTVYGAIGSCLSEPVYSLGTSTNQLEYQEFIKKVKSKVKVPGSKPILLYDGAPAHTTNASK